MSEPEIDQADMAVRPENHVVRLQVEMNRILQVQALQGVGDSGADAHDLIDGHRSAPETAGQASPIQPFEHQERIFSDVTGPHETREMGSGQRWQYHHLRLKSEQTLDGLVVSQPGHLHDEGKSGLSAADAIDVAHGA